MGPESERFLFSRPFCSHPAPAENSEKQSLRTRRRKRARRFTFYQLLKKVHLETCIIVGHTPSVDDEASYRELCGHLKSAGIEVRVDSFAKSPQSAGGLCHIEGRGLVLLDRECSPPQRARALLEAVEELGLGRLGIKFTDLSAQLQSSLKRRGRLGFPRDLAPSQNTERIQVESRYSKKASPELESAGVTSGDLSSSQAGLPTKVPYLRLIVNDSPDPSLKS